VGVVSSAKGDFPGQVSAVVKSVQDFSSATSCKCS
jgi:hypothetical protein